MIKREKHIIPAFTIFEVTVVLAIMSILISIIAVMVNRFNEQLKISSDLSLELNEWYAFRSNLWRELYFSDSISLSNGICSLYSKGQATNYKVSNDLLQRSTGTDWKQLEIEMESIKHLAGENSGVYEFNFMWKGEVMTMSYPDVPSVKNSIDRYFDDLE